MKPEERHLISKSSYIRGLQCNKALFLYKYHYDLRDAISPEKSAIFSQGHEVGVFAQKLFPNGIDASPKNRFKQRDAVAKTAELIKNGTEIIYEASFQFEQVLVILDILVKKDGKWYGYEVKSSTSISQTYIRDAALQYFIITSCGISFEDFSLITIDTRYVREKDIDPTRIFKITSVLTQAIQQTEEIEKNIKSLKSVLFQKSIPDIQIGSHCFSPYECDFKGFCWKNIADNSIFDLKGITRDEQFEYYHSGIKQVSDIVGTNSLKRDLKIQIESKTSGKDHCEIEKINKLISQITPSIYFTDFEVLSAAIPIYTNSSPFEQIPFQFSVKKLMSDGKISEISFLGEAYKNPITEFLAKFLEATQGNETILVFDKTLETSILNRMKNSFPKFKLEIDNRLDRILDISSIFQKKLYYSPKFKGKMNLKDIATVLVPEIDYSKLAIGSGLVAAKSFESMLSETDIFKLSEIRENLLNYCNTDTLALLKVYQFLKKITD